MRTTVAILGHPLGHTLSPRMHNAAFRALGMNWKYVKMDVPPSRLASAVSKLRGPGWAGANVTIPHKQAVMRHLDSIDPLAKKIGAVNTVVSRRGKLSGFNTDAAGFIGVLRGRKLRIRGRRALMIGAGGAGAAVVHALESAGCRVTHIMDCDISRARRLARAVGAKPLVPGDSSAGRVMRAAHIIVNASPLGMHDGDPSPVPGCSLHRGQVVYDLVYNRRTALLDAARSAGCVAIDGLEMLLCQGGLSFGIWTGRRAPLSEMRRAIAK